MTHSDTALILIGFQNDFFSADGILSGCIEDPETINHVLSNTIALIKQWLDTPLSMVATPIAFSASYQELDDNPVGVLFAIKQSGAFQQGSHGANTVPELLPFADRIDDIHGKHGLNAFIDTGLKDYLTARSIKNLIFAGAVTTICIDSTARYAAELGYKVTILSDCTAARTPFEQLFYCENIFPIYANVIDYQTLITSMPVLST